VLPTGHVSANGGHGGGGEQVGSSNQGGGGGVGSGGLLILASPGVITLHVHGETYANLDYDFVLSADGGVCTTGTFSAPVVLSKYAVNGTPVSATFGRAYDAVGLRGFGGMGRGRTRDAARQTTPTAPTRCSTTTSCWCGNGVTLTGALKQRFLALARLEERRRRARRRHRRADQHRRQRRRHPAGAGAAAAVASAPSVEPRLRRARLRE